MKRPFTMLAGLLLFVVGLLHLYRLYAGVAITIGGADIPVWISVPGAIIAGGVGLMTWLEAGK